ncbi:unnamed protein product [Candida verbasci]|uniref:non-specific serine/threonine protein kinase n=1 Tax=Candida verbasci TaxID=1227364 RepID=A0A9W4U1F0_9ASCO|nr:unnamed protein product [Candida verbasci]
MDYLLSFFSYCLPCFPNLSIPSIKINKIKFKILKLLGEGSYSFVYLILQQSSARSLASSTQQYSSSSLFALKKIKCLYGNQDEIYKKSLIEISNYKKFEKLKNPHLINMITYEILNDYDGSKSIYIVLPYFENSLQDKINNHLLNNETFYDESDGIEILKIFIGICRGVSVLHNYKSKVRKKRRVKNSSNVFDQTTPETETLLNDDENEIQVGSNEVQGISDDNDDDNDDDDDDEDDDEDFGNESQRNSFNLNSLVEPSPYGHFDLKPSNIMMSPEGLPVVSDLGSCKPARTIIKNKQQALNMTDFVQQYCSLPYRAPELFQIDINQEIDESVDIWSLGCILYSILFNYSPFEKLEIEQGGNLSFIIQKGKFEIPKINDDNDNDNHKYSQGLIKLIQNCLKINAKERPNINELLESSLKLLRNQEEN